MDRPISMDLSMDIHIHGKPDYRAVNERTYHDSYPLPNIESTFDTLSGSSWDCTLDLRAGYHNVPVAMEDRDKTQFVTRRRTWRWKLMPFGLSTTPGQGRI